MDFKSITAPVLIGFVACLTLAGCNSNLNQNDSGNEHIIGERLAQLSPLTNREGTSQNRIAVFDKTVRVIHRFDTDSMAHLDYLHVRSPQTDHYLLFDQTGNYVIDFTDQNLSIFNNVGAVNNDPLQFQGQPVSAAFRASTGQLVVYDSLQSVGILTLDKAGNVQGAWVGGPVVNNNASISAGDMTADGRLVLALSDGSIAIVDLAQSIAQHAWVKKVFDTGLQNIAWLAPVTGSTDQILLRADGVIEIMSLTTQTVVGQPMQLSGSQFVFKYGKSPDPHLLLQTRNGDGIVNDGIQLVYAQNSQLQTKTIYTSVQNIVDSRVNLATDNWTYVDSTGAIESFFDDINLAPVGRRLNRLRLSDLLALHSYPIDDNTQVVLSESSVFQLYGSELGKATRTYIDSGAVKETRNFNRGPIAFGQ